MNADVDRLSAALAGRYAVDREVGRGASAIVYLAQDLKYGRSVAVKVLRGAVAAAFGPERFLREIRIAARLQHPHILPMLEAGDADGMLYYVMPYFESQSLRARLKRERQLAIDEAVAIGQDVASALAHAHDHGVLHRDIKPENILLSGGQAVVADFGIARAIESGSGGSSSSGTRLAVGTPAYMSPEQASGGRLDGRTDVYSLGCVLFEMLVGEPPFTGVTAQAVIARHRVERVPEIRTVRPTVPEGLARVIFKAMAKVPADRYPGAVELGHALSSYAGIPHSRWGPAGVATLPSATSIAVLPFLNLSADPENEYFSDGLSEELMSALCKVAGLRVAARTSSFAFKGKDEDVRAIGPRLNVRTVLSGSVRRAGKRLRITAQLVNVAEGYHIWSEQYDRELDDVFAIQDEITSAIVGVLKLTLLGDGRSGTTGPACSDVGAYELYLRGRSFSNKRTEQGFERAITYLRQAVARDPGCAAAHAALADCYTLLGIYGARPPVEVMPLAIDAAEKALLLDPSLAEAHVSLGCVRATFQFDWAAAEAEFRCALAIKPSYATAHHWYALNCLSPQGRFEEGLAHIEAARELDPLSPAIGTSVGVQLYFGRRYPEAVEAYRRTLDLDDRFAMAFYFLGLALVELKQYAEAAEKLNRAIELTGGTAEMNAAVGYACARAGDQAGARAALDTLGSRDRYASPVLAAQVYAGLGDCERALTSLENAYAGRAADLVWLKVRPAFDGLREHERYHALLALMRLEGEPDDPRRTQQGGR